MDDSEPLNRTSYLDCSIEIVPGITIVLEKSCGVILYKLCVSCVP